jgi:cell wall assembly regulator SMI1
MTAYEYSILSVIKNKHPDQYSLNKKVEKVFIEQAENELKVKLPYSFKQFLRLHNGAKLCNNYQVLGVFNPQDPKKSWDNLVRQNKLYAEYSPRSSLILFCRDDYGNDIYFDTEDVSTEGEYGVVFLDHETAIETKIADNFYEWLIDLVESSETNNTPFSSKMDE